MNCPNCGNERTRKNGRDRNGTQKYFCPKCRKHFNSSEIPKPKIKTMGISIDEFMRNNDIETQMREAVAKLTRGTLFKRAQFVQEFGISKTTGYVDILNADEFAPYRGSVNADTQYFGHPEDIKMLKEKRLLK